MAIQDKDLKSFFNRQKKASIESLLSNGIKDTSCKSLTSNVSIQDISAKNSLEEHKVQKIKNRDITLKPLANREQIVSNSLANGEQTVSKPLANREQDVNGALAEPLSKHTVDEIVGNERSLLFYIFKKCQSIGSLETNLITTNELINVLHIKPEHIRNIIYRLTKKSLFQVVKYKSGRSGWRKFKLSKNTFQTLTLDENIESSLRIREQTVSKLPVIIKNSY